MKESQVNLDEALEFGESIQSNKERGTRQVFHGRFKGQPAIIKCYSHPRRAWLHWRMCDSHGRIIRRRGIPAPDIWYSGQQPGQPGYLIVYQSLPEPQDFRWMKAPKLSFEQRLPGYRQLLGLFALMHQRGVAQSDTTPGNFIESQGTLFAIDEDRMNIRPWPLSRGASLKNLASLITQFAPVSAEQSHLLYRDYAKARGWSCRERDPGVLARQIARFREWRNDKKAFNRRQKLRWLAAVTVTTLAVSGLLLAL